MSASFAPEWLALRETADAQARSEELAALLGERLSDRSVVMDLGCGTGSLARWLAPRLPGRQHWVLYDHDPRLLAHAVAGMPAPHTAEPLTGDIAGLRERDLGPVSAVTASALLDLLDGPTVEGVVRACTGASRPALFSLSVTGTVRLSPEDPLDTVVGAAFNDHQRRDGKLGPDAVGITAAAFRRHGATVRIRPSAWRLDATAAPLLGEWLCGWVGAAAQQRRDRAFTDYLARRLDQAESGMLCAVVEHEDLLALPGGAA